MAVQKRKKSRSKRDSRRSQINLEKILISIDKYSKETHKRHNITNKGFYKGIKIIEKKYLK